MHRRPVVFWVTLRSVAAPFNEDLHQFYVASLCSQMNWVASVCSWEHLRARFNQKCEHCGKLRTMDDCLTLRVSSINICAGFHQSFQYFNVFPTFLKDPTILVILILIAFISTSVAENRSFFEKVPCVNVATSSNQELQLLKIFR